MTSRYLPWWRTGSATLITQADGPGIPSQATVTLSAAMTGAPGRTATVPARLYGPGEVTSVDERQVIRTEPPPGTTDFEPNHFCSVEFLSPELPWMFTPAAPDAQGHLRPWLVLVVVRQDRARFDHGERGRPGVLSVDPSAELPDLGQSWAWAHVQVSGDGDARTILRDGDRAQKLSRLICPRLLEPGTGYLAAVVPAFRQGAEAGLGRPVTEGPLRPAWEPSDTFAELPAFVAWTFATGPAGDFEQLVSRMEPHQMSARDVAGLGVDSPAQAAGVPAAGRILVPGALGNGGDTPAPLPQEVPARLAALLGLDGNPPHPDLPVPLPVYGRWHAGRRVSDMIAGGGWPAQLNLHLAARAVAALGTRVVQEHQEQLMASAWRQAGPIQRANRLLRQGQLAREASMGVMRHVSPLPDEVLLAVAGPAGQRLSGGHDRTVAAAIAASRVPVALVSAAARRLIRARGPVARGRGVTIGTLITRANLRDGTGRGRPVGDPPPRPPGMVAVDDLGRPLDLPQLCSLSPEWWQRLPDAERRDIQAVRDGMGAFALGRGPCSSPPVAPALPVGELATAVRTGLDPEQAITTAVLHRLTLPGSWHPADPLEPVLVAPEFPAPMYRALAELAPAFLLPGIETLPVNSVSLVGANPWFIEAFMAGLNHEMGRELLWRGYPTDQRGTCFRRFWDRAGTGASGERLDDIAPIPEWDPAAPLGAAGSTGRRPAAGGSTLVLVLRGELLRRYPHTIIYAARAAWSGRADAAGHRLPELPASATERRPAFGGTLPPDVAFAGFDLTPEEARGGADDPGWYIVFAEHPTQPRHGLDAEAPGVATGTWGDLSWKTVTLTGSGYVALGADDPPVAVDPAKDPRGLHFRLSSTSDQIAAVVERRPYRVAVHARRLLPAPEST